jgi:hypothetical protein
MRQKGRGRGRERLSYRSSGEWLPWASVSQDSVEDVPSRVNDILFRRGLAAAPSHDWSIHRWMWLIADLRNQFRLLLDLVDSTLLPYSCPGWVVRQKVSPSLSRYDDAGQFIVA